jgi:hypothetical protein
VTARYSPDGSIQRHTYGLAPYEISHCPPTPSDLRVRAAASLRGWLRRLSLSEDGACYLGACAFAVLAVPLRAGRVANLRASLAVSPSHANVAAYVSHRHVPTADDHDAAAMPQRQLPLLDPPLGEGEAGYSLAAGFCQVRCHPLDEAGREVVRA